MRINGSIQGNCAEALPYETLDIFRSLHSCTASPESGTVVPTSQLCLAKTKRLHLPKLVAKLGPLGELAVNQGLVNEMVETERMFFKGVNQRGNANRHATRITVLKNVKEFPSNLQKHV